MNEDYHDFLDMLASMTPSREISHTIQDRPSIKKKLRPFHPIKAAALISGLLTLPALQANTLRLEMLIHLILSHSLGKKEPMAQQLHLWLNKELGATSFVYLEDPVEDVFISNVITDIGNIRIFEGIWESSDFYLQRMLNIIKTLPDGPSTRQLKREVYGILMLSEEIAERRHLNRFLPGGGNDKGAVRIPSDKELKALSKTIVFTLEDLQRLEILPADIEPFIFDLQYTNKLKEQSLEESDLQQHPIVKDCDKWFILLPNSISFAVRTHILNWMIQHGCQESFDKHLVMEYQEFLQENPIMGASFPRQSIPVQDVQDKYLMTLTREFDTGRYIQVIVIIDRISGYQQHGLLSFESEIMDEYNDQINIHIKDARSYFRKQEGFKQGLTLVVGCGYGRPNGFRAVQETPDWLVEFISAPDFQTLAWTSETSPLFLWKLINQVRHLKKQGVSIANANGLLNLYGWWVDTNYLMIPADVEFGDKPIHMMIPTDSLAEIRRNFRQGWDLHVLPLPNGKLVRVRRKDIDSYFPDDVNQPLYACIDAVRQGQLLGAWVGKQSIWWVSTESGETGLSRDMVFKVWDAVHNWLGRAVPVFERRLHKVANKVVQVILNFDDVKQEYTNVFTKQVLPSRNAISIEQSEDTIRINFRDSFFANFHNPQNIAERMLMRAVANGALQLTGEIPCEELLDIFENEIVPNDDARYFHMFEAIRFRDNINYYDRSSKLFIDGADEAMSKLGLGWLVQDRSKGERFSTAEESTRFLNKVIEKLWERMQANLHTLNRVQFIEQALRYIEGVENQRLLWQRTIRAVIALRDNPESTKAVAVEQLARCNASTIALRLLVEMAISECPLDGGEHVGILDLTPLMSDMLFIFNFGGLSDAIIKGVMKPEIKIAPNGDILSHIGFRDEVVDPFGQEFESVRLDHENARYEKHFESSQPLPTVQGVFPADFLAAFKAEFGLSIDSMRGTRDALENLAIEKERCVFIAYKDELLAYCGNSEFTTQEDTQIFLERFSLWPREAWDKAPKGFTNRDWYPWLFGRALSLVARPVIQLENNDNPRYVISPGLISDGTTHTISQYYEAEIATSKCKSLAMKRWIDDEKARQSYAFVTEVADVMKGAGYEIRIEIQVTELLNEKTPDRDYGDVDVLAWKPGQDDILAIECKDLKLTKTPNEIAEQMNHFSGQILPSGKRDELRKHLDRCAFLNEKAQRVAKTLGIGDRNIHIRNIVCFSKPNPTQYMASRFPDVTFLTIEELSRSVK